MSLIENGSLPPTLTLPRKGRGVPEKTEIFGGDRARVGGIYPSLSDKNSITFQGGAENSCATSTSSRKEPSRLNHILHAFEFVGIGLLLHRLPPRLPPNNLKTILPADWKVWARILLGVGALQQINQAFNWRPKPWLSAMEAMAIITPIAAGFSRTNFKQTLVMAPMIAMAVQATSLLQKQLEKRHHHDDNACGKALAWIRLGTSFLMGLVALVTYPKLYNRIATSGLVGQQLKQKAMEEKSILASATFTTCPRGCSPGSFICLGETADVLSGFGGSADLEEEDSPSE